VTTDVDVLVVGAGPVGLFAGAALAAAGLDVAIWERRERRAPLSRAIGVHPPALAALDTVGVAEPLLAEAVRVARADARVALAPGDRVDTRPIGTVSFERVSRRFPFVATLAQHRTEALLAAVAPTVQHGMEVVGIAPDPNGVTVRALHGLERAEREADVPERAEREADGPERAEREIRAAFVVVADGPSSPARTRLGVRTRSRVYRDAYLMGDVDDTTPDGDRAVVTLTPDGVVESFPLPGGVRRFVVHTPRLLDGTTAGPDELARIVADRTGLRIDPATSTMSSAFGVRRTIAERFAVGTRIALVGDAAHEISPIGGQGMNLGWLDVAELVPVLLEARRRTPGSLDAWSARRRRAAIGAARQAELNMAVSAPGSPLSVSVRSAALGALLRGPAGTRLARTYAMGGDRD
jgi:2-polyprenyl-6-methoxyphenol hydroxylase-like FAD-dependent oxidoreductase